MNIPVTVTKLVAGTKETTTTELPPLASAVDPNALQTLVESGDDSLDINFTYDGHDVEVSGDGTIQVNHRHS